MRKYKIIKLVKKIEPVIKIACLPFAKIFGKSKNMEKAFFHPLIRAFSNKSECDYIQYIAFPKKINEIITDESKLLDYSEFAIVIQGQILYHDNFTLNTIQLYRKYYHNVRIILSTWKGIDETFKKEVEKYSVEILENESPENYGAQNVNMQIYSSLMGAKRARDLGCKYVVKTRTDQRYYAYDMLVYLKDIIHVFPIRGNTESIKKRLVFLNFGSYKKLPFFLCDFFSFGEVEDIIQLYSISHDKRELNYHKQYSKEEYRYIKKFYNSIEITDNISPYEVFKNFNSLYFKYLFAESYILYHFYDEKIKKINIDENLFDLHRKFLSQYLVVIDHEPLMMLWVHHGEQTVEQLTSVGESGKLDFKSWMRLYINDENLGT